MASPGLKIVTDRLEVWSPEPEAAAEVASYYVRNREHHRPWDPPRPEGFETEGYWRDRLERARAEQAEGAAVRLFLAEKAAAPQILGAINFTGITRGPFQACRVGYSLDLAAVGRGLMSEALRAAIAHMFEHEGLHRVEANYVPTNERSGRLLRRLGFLVEGYARDYLFVGGAWRDHVLTSLTSADGASPCDRTVSPCDCRLKSSRSP